MTDRLTITRNVAVLLNYLYDKWRDKNPGGSQDEFGQFIRETSAFAKAPRGRIKRDQRFLGGNLSQLLNAGEFISGPIEEILRKAVPELLRKLEIADTNGLIDLDNISFELYWRYGREQEIRDNLGDFAYYMPRKLPLLNEASTIFSGIWRFFFVVPAAAAEPHEGRIRSNIVFFHEAEEDDRRVYAMGIGPQNARWMGRCWRAGKDYVHLLFREPEGGRTALIAAPYPGQTADRAYKIAGVATFLLYPEALGGHGPHTIVSTLFFGTSCTAETCGVGDQLIMGPVDEKLRRILELAQNGSHLTPDQENTLSDAFRMATGISVAQFSEKFQYMHQYLRDNRAKIDIQFGSDSFAYLLDDRCGQREGFRRLG